MALWRSKSLRKDTAVKIQRWTREDLENLRDRLEESLRTIDSELDKIDFLLGEIPDD